MSNNYGTCHVCRRPIEGYIGEFRPDFEYFERPRDKPEWGLTVQFPSKPFWPCGHTFIFELKCYKRMDGKFEYR